VEARKAVGMMVGMASDFKAHDARKRFKMVPDVTAADGANLDAYEALILNIVERFYPEARPAMPKRTRATAGQPPMAWTTDCITT
jgi:hypothetical protein